MSPLIPQPTAPVEQAQPAGQPAPQAAPVAPQAKPRVPVKASTAEFKVDYEKYVNKATLLIHSKETRDSVLQQLDGPDPVQKVATAGVMIMSRLDDASRASGSEVQDTVKIFGAKEIIGLLVEIGEAAGKFNLSEDYTMLALSVCSQDYITSEAHAGRLNPKELKVRIEMDLRKMPPKFRKEVHDTQKRLPEIARRYNHGKGLPDPQGGA